MIRYNALLFLLVIALSSTALSSTALSSIALSSIASPRPDSNFGFGGATTHAENATDYFAPTLSPAVNAIGLELVGLSQQIEFAHATLNDIDSERDLFWVWAGTNNILISTITGTANAYQAPIDLYTALENLYTNLGARIFVVPNLMLLGNIPQNNTNETSAAEINAYTEAQNASLKVSLNLFALTHPDATLVPLDVQTLFSDLENSSVFQNVTEACFTTGLPNGISCDNYLYADDIHFSSAAAKKIAELAVAELNHLNVRRVVTLGDSFVDTGSFFDTTSRAIGLGIPTPPSYEGRFSDGPNVIDHLESLLNVEVYSRAFSQPSRATLTSSEQTVLDDHYEVIVPKRIKLDQAVYFYATIHLSFDQNGTCLYRADRLLSNTLVAKKCTNALQPGSTTLAREISFQQNKIDNDMNFDIFYYQ